jgi:4-diphosphocytidyl-2-C-methyl-D-erythritol kinase
MISFPNAKINIGLNVVEKRLDGYHNLETIFYPVPLSDILEILLSDEFSFHSSGIELNGNTEDNLVVRAYRLMQEKCNLPAVKIHLHKIIPHGAGLGGGSSDAAFTLKMLNSLFKSGLTNGQLRESAGQLGADCPFFIDNIPAFATGTGNHLVPVELDLSAYRIVMVKPPVSVSTSLAYRTIQPCFPEIHLPELIKMDPESWKNSITNDFEIPVFRLFPEIAAIRDRLYEAGAIYASMTGSGSAVYGFFREIPPGLNERFPASWFFYP